MNSFEALKRIIEDTIANPKLGEHNYHYLLYQKNLYWFAYKRICTNLYFQGRNPITLGNLTEDTLDLFIEQLRKNNSPRQLITKSVKITLNSQIPQYLLLNYILEEIISLILEVLYSTLLESSSPLTWVNKSTHWPLREIESNIVNSKYLVGYKLDKLFHEIDNQHLIQILSKKISDQKFLNILKIILDSNYLNEKEAIHSLTNIPRVLGGHLLYVLWDIYYNQVDSFVTNYLRYLKFRNIARKNHTTQKNFKITKLRREKLVNSASKSEKKFGNLEFLIISYIRYGNQIIILLNRKADYHLALLVKQKLDTFLTRKLQIKKYESHNQIIDIQTGQFEFAGYEISLRQQKVIIRASLSHLINLLLKYRFIKYKKNRQIRPISQTKLLAQENLKIVENYNSILYHLTSYYSGISTNKRLQYCEYLLKFSCAMTLAHKHKSSISKIFKQYGNDLNIQSKLNAQSVKFQSQYKNYLQFWQLEQSFLDPFIKYQ